MKPPSAVATVNFQVKRACVGAAHIITLLERVGIEGHRRPNDGRVTKTKSFWLRNEADLSYILFDAHKSFRALCKKFHPDIPGGDHGRMAQLTADWRMLKRLFAKKNVRLND